MRVRVYWNSTKKVWSVRQSGRVVKHLRELDLWAVTFVVSEKGRQRVLRERRKSVHAYAEGVLSERRALVANPARAIRYNPYEGPDFTCHGLPVKRLDAWMSHYAAIILVGDFSMRLDHLYGWLPHRLDRGAGQFAPDAFQRLGNKLPALRCHC